jgi:hypothetical protein
VRVDDADAMPGCYVLKNEVAEERRLSRAAFPDYVQVMPAVGLVQNEGMFLPPLLAEPEDNVPFLHFSQSSPYSVKEYSRRAL